MNAEIHIFWMWRETVGMLDPANRHAKAIITPLVEMDMGPSLPPSQRLVCRLAGV